MVSNSALQGESMNRELNWYLVAPSPAIEKKQIGEHESKVEGVIHDEPIEMQHLNITEVECKEDPSTNEGTASEEVPVNEDYIDQGSQEPPLFIIPDPLTWNNPEVSSPTISSSTNASVRYVLPIRNNRGKPPNRYCPDVEERRSKYPIANYVSTQHLSNPIHAFIKTLLSCHIPKNVEETLADPKWALAIQEEMEALQNNNS